MAGLAVLSATRTNPKHNLLISSVASRPVDGIVISFSLELPHLQRAGAEAPGC